jgi:hypothetical protein
MELLSKSGRLPATETAIAILWAKATAMEIESLFDPDGGGEGMEGAATLPRHHHQNPTCMVSNHYTMGKKP